MEFKPSGPLAQQLRARKKKLLEALEVPPEGLPGSLALTHGRCGKPTCHCAKGEGHASWSLTYMAEGKKRVEYIPAEWVELVRQRVGEGKAFREAVAELMAINAHMLALWRKEQKQQRGGRVRPKGARG